MQNIALNRSRFPAGLIQPKDSYRFGLEALLLASYAQALTTNIEIARVIELGSGCGASLLAFALEESNAHCLGIDREEELIKAANANAKLLGLDFTCAFMVNNLHNLSPELTEWKNSCQLVMANPPWRVSGRKTPKPLRLSALWRDPDTFSLFCKAANFFMEPTGHFICVIQAECLDCFTTEAHNANLFMQHIIQIKTSPDKKAKMLMLHCARNNSCAAYATELVLPQNSPKNWRFKELFIMLCPWLQNNL